MADWMSYAFYSFSVQIYIGLINRCLNFWMDWRLDDLTKVCVNWIHVTLQTSVNSAGGCLNGIVIVLGLTSLQQSVAIDRLQRILGVLQRPHMG